MISEIAPLPTVHADLHAMLLDDGFEFWDGLYHKSGTTWRLEFHNGWRLVAHAAVERADSFGEVVHG